MVAANVAVDIFASHVANYRADVFGKLRKMAAEPEEHTGGYQYLLKRIQNIEAQIPGFVIMDPSLEV